MDAKVYMHVFTSWVRGPFFYVFRGITIPACVGHKFRTQVYYYGPPQASIGLTQIVGCSPLVWWERVYDCFLFVIIT